MGGACGTRHAYTLAQVTNLAQIQNLFTIAARHGGAEALRRHLCATIVASVGPVCTRTLQAHGVQVDVETIPPKMGPHVTVISPTFCQQVQREGEQGRVTLRRSHSARSALCPR